MDKLSLEDGKLQIATSQGHMTETIPESYWEESKEATTVNYQLEGNTVSFQAEQQQQGQTLVVDPSLSWSTYLGGSNGDGGGGVTTDGSGNVYVTGGAGSGFPTTSGAYQGSNADDGDAYLSKFTSGGSLSWSTYLGGIENDYGVGITTNGSGSVYVTGTADTTFPTTSGAYQTSFGGTRDAFLSKFTSSGSLSWSTYLGGSNGDRGNGVTTDGSGNVYVTGTADTTFPTTSGAYQQSFGGGGIIFRGDAFLSKFTSSGSLSWSTYLGGGSYESGSGVTTDGSGNVYVTGRADTTFPTTSGAYQTSYGGGFRDAFLSKFTSSGSLSWSTYLGGSNFDAGSGVTTDGSGNVYATGGAESGFPTTSGAYQGSNSGDVDAFLSKFTSSGSLSWSTYLGGFFDESGDGVTTDGSGNVYVIGSADSTGFPTTSGAYQDSFGGGRFDAFLSKFTSSGSLSYSTYLGGNNTDEGYDVATDGSGNVYVIGSADSTGFPTTSGSYQPFLKGDEDAFLTRFNFNSVGTGTDQARSAAIGLQAYPNPASKTVTLSYELRAAQSQVTLKVVDEQGKVIIRKEQGRQPAGKYTQELKTLQEASPGTYFIRLKLGGDKQQVERVVKVE
jgi:hypothetical protein